MFADFQAQLAANPLAVLLRRSGRAVYGFNRPDAKPSEPVIWNWWRQGMMGSAKGPYDGIVAFSQTDFTEDLKAATIPVLVMHREDDQIVPYADSGPLSVEEWHAENLQGFSAWNANNLSRTNQRRPVRIY